MDYGGWCNLRGDGLWVLQVSTRHHRYLVYPRHLGYLKVFLACKVFFMVNVFDLPHDKNNHGKNVQSCGLTLFN